MKGSTIAIGGVAVAALGFAGYMAFKPKAATKPAAQKPASTPFSPAPSQPTASQPAQQPTPAPGYQQAANYVQQNAGSVSNWLSNLGGGSSDSSGGSAPSSDASNAVQQFASDSGSGAPDTSSSSSDMGTFGVLRSLEFATGRRPMRR